MSDPEEAYLIIELTFSHYKVECRPDNEELERIDETVTINIEYGDLEDFVAEIRYQF
jgi:hypothetical protein